MRLVERSTRSLALTAQGLAFLPHAQALLEQQEAARAAVRPAAEAPPARLELLLGASAALQALWTQGETELAVVTAATPPAGATLLRREPLAWVASPRLVLRAGEPVPLVLLGSECPVRDIALGALARAGRAYHVQLGCTGSQAAVAAIRAGWGVGCLNLSAIPPDLEVLTHSAPRRWPSPGRLAFYLLARPGARTLGRALAAWAR